MNVIVQNLAETKGPSIGLMFLHMVSNFWQLSTAPQSCLVNCIFLHLSSQWSSHLYSHSVTFLSCHSLKDLIDCYLVCFLLGPLMNIMACVLVLHTWSNFTAELTRFADREFHSVSSQSGSVLEVVSKRLTWHAVLLIQDWWNSESYATYYRKWNVPIHDWLHAYLFQDLKPVSTVAIFYVRCVHSHWTVQFLKNRAIVALPAFLLSSMVHDYHIGVAMGFFTPLFLILFAGIGGKYMTKGAWRDKLRCPSLFSTNVSFPAIIYTLG